MPVVSRQGSMAAKGLGFTAGASGPPPGSDSYTTAGTYTWVAPAGVTKVSVVAVGAGKRGQIGDCCSSGWGGSGGDLRYVNNVSVTPGSSYTVVVGLGGVTSGSGGYSSFNTTTLLAQGGNRSGTGAGTLGGAGKIVTCGSSGTGGGGAGGYSGNGGTGTGGSGGNGGNTSAAVSSPGGGGVGLLGQGVSGANGGGCNVGGGGGSGGCSGLPSSPYGVGGTGGSGGAYGGGAGGSGRSSGTYGSGGVGAVRIVWPGTTRQFPTTCVGLP